MLQFGLVRAKRKGLMFIGCLITVREIMVLVLKEKIGGLHLYKAHSFPGLFKVYLGGPGRSVC